MPEPVTQSEWYNQYADYLDYYEYFTPGYSHPGVIPDEFNDSLENPNMISCGCVFDNEVAIGIKKHNATERCAFSMKPLSIAQEFINDLSNNLHTMPTLLQLIVKGRDNNITFTPTTKAPNLKSLTIPNIDNVESYILDGLWSITIEHLDINYLYKLPTTLESLRIDDCENNELEQFTTQCPNLQYLSVGGTELIGGLFH